MISWNFRRTVCSDVRYVFLISCWVIVEPPSRRPSATRLKTARTMPSGSKPLCW